MSMKGQLYMMAALAMMGVGGMPSYSEPRRYSPPRKLTPEEEEKILEERKTKFLSDLERHNEQRKVDFPKWKEYQVHGLTIIAFSQKNAIRDMNSLMHQNYIAIKD